MTKSSDARVIADEAAAEERLRHLPIGPEDTVNEIDTNADGKPDVRVITDRDPQQAILDGGPPDVDPPPGGPFGFGGGSTPDPDLEPFARTWRDRRRTT